MKIILVLLFNIICLGLGIFLLKTTHELLNKQNLGLPLVYIVNPIEANRSNNELLKKEVLDECLLNSTNLTENNVNRTKNGSNSTIISGNEKGVDNRTSNKAADTKKNNENNVHNKGNSQGRYGNYFNKMVPNNCSNNSNLTNLSYDPLDFYEFNYLEKFDRRKFSANLQYKGTQKLFRNCSYSKRLENLSFGIDLEKRNEMSIIIEDAAGPGFRLPYEIPFPFTKYSERELKQSKSNSIDFAYEIRYRTEGPFCFYVKRRKTAEKFLDTCVENKSFVFSEKYTEFTVKLPSKYLYGLGERRGSFLFKPGVYLIWPRDNAFMIDEGNTPTNELYGYHPVYIVREKSGLWSLTYLRSTNPIEFTFGSENITFKIVGSRVELKIILCMKTPEDCIRAYHEYINKFTLMPFWSFGFHQTRWGYEDISDLLSMISNYKNYKIPLEVVWSDIDYMNDKVDFTVDSLRFPKNDLQFIKQNGLKYVLIIDLGIGVRTENDTIYSSGDSKNVFIKSAVTNENLYNWVWPGLSAYPDFNSKNISWFWSEGFRKLNESIFFDGIWLDMNEPAAFIIAERSISGEVREDYSNYTYPFLPGNDIIENKTISIDALHENKGIFINQDQNLTEIDFHSLNGFTETVITNLVLGQNFSMKLPFIISRSSFVGLGAYAGHWTGDNSATWEMMRLSIPALFNFQIFGIPFLGADICGFEGVSTEELCARWFQLGSFYPFSRNHNMKNLRSQEAYAWGPQSVVLKAAKASLILRYSLIKFYYSLFVRSEGEGSIIKPLFFEFPEDASLLELDTQFLIGAELMCAPALYPEKNKVDIIFPSNTVWYDFLTGRSYYKGNVSVEAPLNGSSPLFIRRGKIVPVSNSSKVTRLREITNRYSLKCAIAPVPSGYFAEGTLLYLEDFLDEKKVRTVCWDLGSCELRIQVTGMKLSNHKLQLDFEFKILHPSKWLPLWDSETIFVEALELYGLKDKYGFTKDIQVIDLTSQPWRVIPNSKRSIIIGE